ncbi:stage II sporulation protein R [Velocimicrobium porci]|uniref:Stage II sporulation protein R n=1 Tax=Velocimicrobium porci TaxID=2606634 RepID=A0A6L5XXC1_9FIRM|nr:stage II sporulation protein R [Velocimicrobium porci]MSS63274.1 stage II sporulation protein R [Velocimicrobium porci]
MNYGIEKLIFVFAGIFVISNIIFGKNQMFLNESCEETKVESQQKMQQGIAEHIIRFHVIANSDTKEDQELKLKVKDRVVEAMRPKLKNVSSIEEARKILRDNQTNMEKLADKVMKEEGYSYQSHAELGMTTFPVKRYGDLTFPAGRYEAFRILIGKAEGKNWWCVMFPTLCYVDESYDVITEENKETFKKVLTKQEYESIEKQEGQYFYKFKLLEWIKEL